MKVNPAEELRSDQDSLFMDLYNSGAMDEDMIQIVMPVMRRWIVHPKFWQQRFDFLFSIYDDLLKDHHSTKSSTYQFIWRSANSSEFLPAFEAVIRSEIDRKVIFVCLIFARLKK